MDEISWRAAVVQEIGKRFRTFGGGKVNRNNPISHALRDAPLCFAAGVNVEEVVLFVEAVVLLRVVETPEHPHPGMCTGKVVTINQE